MTDSVNNKSGKIVLLIFLLICSGLGIAAFVMSLTKKGGCKEGYEDVTDPPLNCQAAVDNHCINDLDCCNAGNCKSGQLCGWDNSNPFGPCTIGDGPCIGDCADNMCESRNCDQWHCVPKICEGKEGEHCTNDNQCVSLFCNGNKCSGPDKCKSSKICPSGETCNGGNGSGAGAQPVGTCGSPKDLPTEGGDCTDNQKCSNGWCFSEANIGTCAPWLNLCDSPS